MSIDVSILFLVRLNYGKKGWYSLPAKTPFASENEEIKFY